MQIFLASFARFVIAFTFSFLMIWSNELYPTTIRSSGLGIVFGFGLIGGYLSPFLVEFSIEHIGLNPVIFLGLIGVICAIPVWFLNETLGKDL